jgi:prepilin-type N-terminal cleavage/methylation domain-containing protein
MRKPFTLIELLIVIAIIGILVTLLLPSLGKARRKAMIAGCLSNHKQINIGNQLYLKNNNGRFPFAKFSGADTNTGRHWVGKLGSGSNYRVNVSKRPLNIYLGYTLDNIDVPTAKCPLDLKQGQYNNSGTNYMGAARQEHNDDLDTLTKSIFFTEVKKPAKMTLVGETGGWHYAANPDNPWKAGSQFHEPGKPVYSFSFVDGHAKNLKIWGGLGITADSAILNFRNF